MQSNDKSLTLRILSTADGADADAFLEIFADTLAALKEIDKNVSEYGAETLAWRVVDAGLRSPIFATLAPAKMTSNTKDEQGSIVVEAFISGLQQLEQTGVPPAQFNEAALRATAKLTRSFAKGVQRIEYRTNGATVAATHTVAQNANNAIHLLELHKAKLAGRYFEYGTIEGHLKTLTEQSDRDKLMVVDELTGKPTRCYIRRTGLDEEVRKSWKRRVAVSGTMTVDRNTGDAIEMDVDEIRALRERADLPQIENLRGIDITSGIEPSDYVRGLRDAE